MTVNLKIGDLLKKLTEDVKPRSQIYPKPNYAYKSFAILVSENVEIDWWSATHCSSYKEVVEFYDVGDWIIHGHSSSDYCRNDHFCHVYGYRPSSDLNPKFVQAFYRKWSYLRPKSELDLSL